MTPMPNPVRVLVVDDNVDAADSLAEVLQSWGYEACTAYDGEQALEAAKEFRPEVAILDIGLPKLDGFQVAERLTQERDLRLVMLLALTGYHQSDYRARSEEVGFTAYMVKPLDVKALETLLHSARALSRPTVVELNAGPRRKVS